jgi:hypothetical protein
MVDSLHYFELEVQQNIIVVGAGEKGLPTSLQPKSKGR